MRPDEVVPVVLVVSGLWILLLNDYRCGTALGRAEMVRRSIIRVHGIEAVMGQGECRPDRCARTPNRQFRNGDDP
jgi:hypothetical protein